MKTVVYILGEGIRKPVTLVPKKGTIVVYDKDQDHDVPKVRVRRTIATEGDSLQWAGWPWIRRTRLMAKYGSELVPDRKSRCFSGRDESLSSSFHFPVKGLTTARMLGGQGADEKRVANIDTK